MDGSEREPNVDERGVASVQSVCFCVVRMRERDAKQNHVAMFDNDARIGRRQSSASSDDYREVSLSNCEHYHSSRLVCICARN